MARRGSEPALRNRICLGHRAKRLILGWLLCKRLLSVTGPHEGPSRGRELRICEWKQIQYSKSVSEEDGGQCTEQVMFAVTHRRATHLDLAAQYILYVLPTNVSFGKLDFLVQKEYEAE